MKDTFEIKQTEINPYVLMDIVKGEIIFEGRSLVVYPSEFYEGVMEWINDHEHKLKSTAFNLTIDMDYVNISKFSHLESNHKYHNQLLLHLQIWVF